MIIGAGLAGLIAAHAFHGMPIVERGSCEEGHKALLRFRTESVSRLTGIEFKKVRVRKGIWTQGKFSEPTIQLANCYSQKCLGELRGDRSIWNLDPVDRFIAPEDFHSRLLAQVGDRIHWNTEADFNSGRPVTISTAPMPVAMAQVGMSVEGLEFGRSEIQVLRYRIPKCDLYQTIYFPDTDTQLYRASISGDTLIAEFVCNTIRDDWNWKVLVEKAFSLPCNGEWELTSTTKQRYGKIAPIDNAIRKRIMLELTEKHNIFSLGRFATYRNILLDDVVDDIAVVKRLIGASSYERKLACI